MSIPINELPRPYQVDMVALLLTLHCNAACSHCCYECGPHRNKQMSQQQAADYIEQIASIDTVGATVMTGGEVFTNYELLRATLEKAGQFGLKSRVVTNGFWAASAKQANELLQPLVESGLVSFSISYDTLHEQYVKPRNVKIAIEAALDMGLEVAISHVSLRGPDEGDSKKILRALSLPEDAPVIIRMAHVTPGGRAIKKYSLDQMSLVDGKSDDGLRLKGDCGSVLREPVIDPDGNFAACCGTAISDGDGFRKEFIVGNLNDRPLADLVKDLEFNPLFAGLMTEGPWYFYERLNEQNPDLFSRKRFVNICDLCAQVVCNERAQGLLQEILDEQEPGLLLKKMMLEVARRKKLDDSPAEC